MADLGGPTPVQRRRSPSGGGPGMTQGQAGYAVVERHGAAARPANLIRSASARCWSDRL